MSRGKRKVKQSWCERLEARKTYSSDHDSSDDNYSETSVQSDLKSIQDEAGLLDKVHPIRKLWKQDVKELSNNCPCKELPDSSVPEPSEMYTIRPAAGKSQLHAYLLQNGAVLKQAQQPISKAKESNTHIRKLMDAIFMGFYKFHNIAQPRWSLTTVLLDDKELFDIVNKPIDRVPKCLQPQLKAIASTYKVVFKLVSEDAAVKFEDKVLETVEGLNSNAKSTRTACLVALRDDLSRRYVAHVLAPHRASLADRVTRSLRRGDLAERRAAAALAPLLALQVGEEGAKEFMRAVRPALVAVATDRGADVEAQAECCRAAAVLCYLLEDDTGEVLTLLAEFESIFSGGHPKSNGSGRVSGALHAAALDGWALLLPLVSAERARSMLTRGAWPSDEMLEASSLEVRKAAGNALAVAHEHFSEDSEEGERRCMLPVLADLAKDSSKFRAKRDRRVQRATFRHIVKYLEEDELVEETVHLGSETLVLGSWAERGTYAALASALGAGLQICARHSPALRAALRLPDAPPSPLEPVDQRINKKQRQLKNAADFKTRTISRRKYRDNRSAVNAM